MAAQQGFDVFFGIVSDLLEFVETDDAGLVGLFQNLENFLKGELRVVDVAERKAESGHSCRGVETEVGTERFQRLHEPKRHFLTFAPECAKYLTTKCICKFAKACGMEDVDVKAIIIRAKRLLVVAELDEFRFAHASWRHEANVFAVGEHSYELFALFFPVTKIFRRNISADNEWIRNHNALILRQRYENY